MPAMRGVARRLFAVCSAASLVLFVLVAVHWMLQGRPGYQGPRVEEKVGRSTVVVNLVNRGKLRLFHTYRLPAPRPWPDPRPPMQGIYEPSEWANARRVGDFEYFHIQAAPKARQPVEKVVRVLTLPLWAVLGVLAVLPSAWAVFLLRRTEFARRARLGLCRRCGYDLRGSRERCPECGEAAEAKPAVARGGAAPLD